MKRTAEVQWDDPVQLAQAGRAMAGLEFLRAIRDGRLPHPPICALLGYTLTEVEPGHAVFEITPSERHYNPIGVVHGGIAMTLLDSAMGCAVQTKMPAGGGYTTLEAKTNLVRAITGNRPAARHRQGRPCRQAGGDRGSAARRPVGQALRARHQHVHRAVERSLWREHLLPELA